MSRLSIQHVKFARPFMLAGHPQPFAPGSYRVLIDEDPAHGTSFEGCCRVSTHLLVEGTGPAPGRSTLHATTEADLAAALGRDRAPNTT